MRVSTIEPQSSLGSFSQRARKSQPCCTTAQFSYGAVAGEGVSEQREACTKLGSSTHAGDGRSWVCTAGLQLGGAPLAAPELAAGGAALVGNAEGVVGRPGQRRVTAPFWVIPSHITAFASCNEKSPAAVSEPAIRSEPHSATKSQPACCTIHSRLIPHPLA